MNVSSMTVLIYLFNFNVHLNEQIQLLYAIIITAYVNNFYGQVVFIHNNYLINLTIIYLSIETIRLDKISPALYIAKKMFTIVNILQLNKGHIHEKKYSCRRLPRTGGP